jgi:ABC-type uncharacterized transport system auxiliary subunit
MMNRTGKAFLFSAAMLLAGCSMTSSAPPATTYALHPAAAAVSQNKASGVFSVTEPTLPAGFETDQIALYLDNGRRLDYYAGARWAAPLDQVLQDVLVQSGRNALPGMVVDTPDLNIPTNYKLAVKVNEFAPVYAAGAESSPLLKVSMTFTLVRVPEQKVIADFRLEQSRQMETNSLTAITSGLEAMLQAILGEAYATLAKTMPQSPK